MLIFSIIWKLQIVKFRVKVVASVVGCGYWCCAGTERTIPCVVPLSPPKVSSLIVGEFHLSAYLFLKT